MTDPNARAPIAAIAAGIDYQILVALAETLRALLLTEREVVEIDLEVRDAGCVDDIVIHHASEPPRMLQVKHAMLGGSALNTHYLTAPAGRSTILRRLRESFVDLSRDTGAPPAMEIFTDRPLDPNDPMLACRDQNTSLLVPEALRNDGGSKLDTTRAEWLAHLGCDLDDLAALLANLAIVTDRVAPVVREEVKVMSAALGLATDDDALLRATEYVRDWMKDRDRRRGLDRLRSEVQAALGPSDRRAVVQVQAIGHLAEDEHAVAAVDWVGLFAGDDADGRRSLTDPDAWEDRVRPDLVGLRQACRDAGVDRLVIQFIARQAVTFLVGFYLRRAAGFSVAFAQHGSLWSSIDAGTAAVSVRPLEVDAAGTDCAVVFAFSQDVTNDVVRFAADADLPIREVLTVAADTGADQGAVVSSVHAAGLALGAVEAVRDHLRSRPAEALHLFFAGPGALAGLIGYRWNALPPSAIYEHSGGQGYHLTLRIES